MAVLPFSFAMRDSMVFYRSFYEALRDLDNNTKAILYDAIFDYGLNFKEPELTGIAKTVFTLIRPQLDANIRKFDNGSKGGRPHKEEATDNLNETKEEPKRNQSETKAEANVNANANVNSNEKENQNVDEAKVSPKKDDNVSWVISLLNEKAGTAFRATSKETRRIVLARIKEGYTGNDFREVILYKVKQWGKDPEMSEYIRPSTLFGTKFESYLNAAKIVKEEKTEKPVKEDRNNYNGNIRFASPIL